MRKGCFGVAQHAPTLSVAPELTNEDSIHSLVHPNLTRLATSFPASTRTAQSQLIARYISD